MRVSVIGHFAFGKEAANGQTIKTTILTRELKKQLGDSEVKVIDTHGGVKSLLKSPFQVLSALKKSNNVIILPAHNGLRIYGRLLPLFRSMFKTRKIHYVVIGGWLSEFLKRRKGLAGALKKFDGIYVETNSMKNSLETMGFNNIFVMPNFKYLTPLSKSELEYSTSLPHRLCIFSRIMEQKGVEEAIETVSAINVAARKTIYELDMYGPIDTEYQTRFKELQKRFPEYVNYKGVIPSDQSVNVIKNYFALLFPTKFYTEGIPGTLIDACAAGVPVITSLWENYADIFTEDVTGWGFEFGNFNQFRALLEKAANEPEKFSEMKVSALAEMNKFQPDKVVQILLQRMI